MYSSTQIDYVFWDTIKSEKCGTPNQSSQTDNENSYWFGDSLIALTNDGALTLKSPKGKQLSKDFKTLNEKVCSDDIEYSSMALNSTYQQMALFEADSTDQSKIEFFSMESASQ